MVEFKKPTQWQINNNLDFGVGAVRKQADKGYTYDYIGIDLTPGLGRGDVRLFSTKLYFGDIADGLYETLDYLGYDSPADFMAVDGDRDALEGMALSCAEDAACVKYMHGLVRYEVLPDVETAYQRMREKVPELCFEDIELPPGYETPHRPTVRDMAVELRASSSALAQDDIEMTAPCRDTQEKA